MRPEIERLIAAAKDEGSLETAQAEGHNIKRESEQRCYAVQKELDWWLEHGETEELLRHMPGNSVDALVTDPPAGIGFMGREWDKNKGGRDQWIAWLRGVLEECRRVMKPGAMGWVWALPRTAHWTATACEDAGFAVRDVLVHVFGTGFPKSRALLKPAVENWILVKAPGELRELRIEENRISIAETDLSDMIGRSGNSTPNQVYGSRIGQKGIWVPNQSGRWPANFALNHDGMCSQVGTHRVNRGGGVPQTDENRGMFGVGHGHVYGDADGSETVEAWECVEGCPVKILDEQSGERTSGSRKAGVRKGLGYQSSAVGDGGPAIEASTGTASRFFYVAKPSSSERSAGLPDGTRNIHPTVKSIKLMEHLVSLIAAPGDLVLDPFAGSGTTGIAALKQRCRFVGIEKEAEYVQIARHRLAHADALAKTFSDKVGRRTTTAENPKQGRLL